MKNKREWSHGLKVYLLWGRSEEDSGDTCHEILIGKNLNDILIG